METEANQLRMPDLPVDTTTFDDGGNQPPVYEAPQQASQPQEQGEERNEPAPQWKDEKRGEIFARAREKRLAETEPFSGDPNDPNALYGATADQSDMGELEQEALRRRQDHLAQIGQPQQGQPQQQAYQGKPLNGIDPSLLQATVPIIVDGQEHHVNVEDALREFQINRAADRRLEQAKALLQQTQEFQRVNQANQPRSPAEYNEPSGQDDSASDDTFDEGPSYTSRKPANVKELVEKIQLGTPDEAAEALEEFVSSAVNREPAVDETTRVLTALEDHNARQAVVAFAEQNPQLAANPMLQAEATKQIYRGMAEDLLRAGYSMDQLRQAAPTPQQLTQLHKQARINGVRGVRRVSDLISVGYQGAITELRGLVEQVAPRQAQNPAPSMGQRQQRKESLQPQPVARRLSPGMTPQSQPRSQEQSRTQAVARIRQARGQPV